MKVRKAIKKIAALGVGASMVGATLLGASAAYTLADFPMMFMTNGMFNGLISIGANADTIDTFGVVNIMTRMQAEAKTVTEICGAGAVGTTTVSGESVQIKKTGNDLNIGEDLEDMQASADDGDLPNILADGKYKESEGETKNDVTYEQMVNFVDGSGEVIYDQDDDDAEEAGVYLLFPKNANAYEYVLEFDSAVEFDEDDTTDLESTNIEMQGQTYTIIDVTYDGAQINKMTLMSGQAVMWLAQDETVTKTIDGVDHEIQMIDVSENEDSCGFLVDGSSVWIDVDDTRTSGGVTLGVTDAKAVHNVNYDQDICKVYIGAEELVLEDGAEVDMAGTDIDGSLVTFDQTDNEWDGLTISYEPEDDIFLTTGDEWVDPVFGNFKFIMGSVAADNEEMMFSASGNDGDFTFTNYDGKEVVMPFTYVEGSEPDEFYFGDTDDPAAEPEDVVYLEGDTCTGVTDLTDCAGARFLVVTDGDVAHLIEISSISDPDNADPEIDFKDLTYGSTTADKDYENGDNDFNLGSSVGEITLAIDTAAGTIGFDAIDDGEMKTENEAIITINRGGGYDTGRFNSIAIAENVDNSDADDAVTVTPDDDTDEEKIEFDAPAGLTGAVKKSEDDEDMEMYYSDYGMIVEYDSDNQDEITVWHPGDMLYVEAFMAEAEAESSSSEGSGGDCVKTEKVNKIPDTVNKFDTEVTNFKAQNVISVGGPCANAVSAAMLGDPENCAEGFESGKALIQLFDNGNGKYGLLIAGGDGKDTLLASKLMQNFDQYDLSGMKMVATTVSANDLSVAPVAE